MLEIMNPLGTGGIVALGDDNNDIKMIKNSGLGIATENATGGVKEVAGAVTLHTNNQEGAARALAGVFGLPSD